MGPLPWETPIGALFSLKSPSNTVGGTTATARNLISGNQEGGVAIYGGSAVNDLVEGNYIGTDITGTVALGNAYSGVYVGSGSLFSDNPPGSASDNTIGGTAPGAGNVISANGNWGIWVSGDGATGNLIQGNKIGTDLTGTMALENKYSAVEIDGGAANTIGGTTAGAGNVISANGHQGVLITGDGATGNLIQGNEIGTDVAGTVALGNAFWSLELLQVVGNGGGGAQAHFEGSYEGLTLTSSDTYTDLPNPSALVYAGLAGVLVTLSLGVEIAPPSPLGGETGGMPTVPGLQPLSNSALPLIATLLTVTIETSTAEFNPGGEASAAVSFLPVTAGQSLAEHASTGVSGNGGAEEPNEPKEPSLPVTQESSSWQPFLMGLDESLDQFCRDSLDQFMSRDEPAPDKAQPPHALNKPLNLWQRDQASPEAARNDRDGFEPLTRGEPRPDHRRSDPFALGG